MICNEHLWLLIANIIETVGKLCKTESLNGLNPNLTLSKVTSPYCHNLGAIESQKCLLLIESEPIQAWKIHEKWLHQSRDLTRHYDGT